MTTNKMVVMLSFLYRFYSVFRILSLFLRFYDDTCRLLYSEASSCKRVKDGKA